MYEVLVPVDQNENRALHQAKYVAGLPDAAEAVEATVMYVVPPGELDRAEEVEFELVDAAVTAAEHLESAGVSVNRVVEDGGVSQEIVRSADDLDCDELVMGGRKRSPVTKAILGSVTESVVLETDIPVTITGG